MIRFRALGGSRRQSPQTKDPAAAVSAMSGNRVRDIYLNDPKLQKLHPLSLLPLGQLHLLGWLTQHGQADQRLTDGEIHAFLRETTEDERDGPR
jgi:hypothetical protein